MSEIQLTIPGVLPPPRPPRSKDIIRAAAAELAKSMRLSEQDAADLADAYTPHVDGYDLAKTLESDYLWDPDAAMVDDLDRLDSMVDQAHREVCRQWVREWNILPPLPNGTTVQKGVIAGVSDYSPATYTVKEHGCTKDGRFLLVAFEDAQAVESNP